MKIIYVEGGPDTIRMGAAGEFRRGEPKDVPDDLAKHLLAKTSVRFKREREDRSDRSVGSIG